MLHPPASRSLGEAKLAGQASVYFISLRTPPFQGLVVRGISKLSPVADPGERSLVVLWPDYGSCSISSSLFLPFRVTSHFRALDLLRLRWHRTIPWLEVLDDGVGGPMDLSFLR